MTHIPIACTLGPEKANAQADEWMRLMQSATDHRRHDDALRLTFPLARADDVEALARREAECCPFLAVRTDRVKNGMTLEIRASDTDGRLVIDQLTALS